MNSSTESPEYPSNGTQSREVPSTLPESHDLPPPPMDTKSSKNPPSAVTHDKSYDNIIRDIILWRNWKLSLAVLAAATAIWILFEVYQVKFIPLVSQAAMCVVVLIFFCGQLFRLLGRQQPDIAFTGIPEESVVQMAKRLRYLAEEGLRQLLRLGVEGEWYVFAGVVGGLYVLSQIGKCMGLLTLLYVGIVTELTVPVVYVKNEDKIKRCGESIKVKGRILYGTLDEKILKKIKHKVSPPKKEKKVE